MVKTRSQTARDTLIESNRMDRNSDSDSECSIPEILFREQISEFNDGDVLNYRNNAERSTVNQRFTEMNKQINELTLAIEKGTT